MQDKASDIKGHLAHICGSVGHLYKGEYLIEPNCLDSVKQLIKLLKKDDETHVTRRCMGEIRIVEDHLIRVIKSCTPKMRDVFSITLRLLINITTPAMLLFGEEIPRDKIERHIYISLVNYDQRYKSAFADVELWQKICCKLTSLFETEWTERSADDSIEIERILTLLRNILHIPGDVEDKMKLLSDTTVHDEVLCSLRESQILELLLFVSSNRDEEMHYLSLLEVFSLLLREYNPRVLAVGDAERADEERNKNMSALMEARETERRSHKKYTNVRNFKSTFVMKGVKSASNADIICHKSLDNIQRLNLREGNCVFRPRRDRVPVESERPERRSTLSVRLFLKEFCTEFLNSSFSHVMNVVKNRLDSGKTLSHDRTYYFWAITFFSQFSMEGNLNVSLLKNTNALLEDSTFHFIQTSVESAFEKMKMEKKEVSNWVKRIHTILKAYHSLLEILSWMDRSGISEAEALSRRIKSDVFCVAEYRELTLHMLLRYDSSMFPLSYLRDLIQTTHLFIKLFEIFCEQTKFTVEKIVKKNPKRPKKKKEKKVKAAEENWRDKWEEDLGGEVYDCLFTTTPFPEIVPFDAASDVPIDDQKEMAMKRIQRLLRESKVVEAIGLLRSARQVWPENDYFGSDGMKAVDETAVLREIFIAELGPLEERKEEEKTSEESGTKEPEEEKVEDEDEEDVEGNEYGDEYRESTSSIRKTEDFNILDYKMHFAQRKVVESCAILLKNYKKNSNHVNHCTIKLLHRIAWECCKPAFLYQASLFWTLLNIMNESDKRYAEINTFAVNLMRKFRKHAEKNPVVFLELLFWKNHRIVMSIQNGYEPYEKTKKPGNGKGKRGRKRKEENDEKLFSESEKSNKSTGKDRQKRKVGKRKSSNNEKAADGDDGHDDGIVLPENWRKELILNLRSSDGSGNSSDSEEECVANNDETVKTNSANEADGAVVETTNSENNLERRGVKKRLRRTKSWLSESSDGEVSTAGNQFEELKAQSKTKRPRFISSDSDVDNFKSGEEEEKEEETSMAFGKKIGRRSNVIDSDSDLEDVETDIRNK